MVSCECGYRLAWSYAGRNQLARRFTRFEHLQSLAYVAAEQRNGNPAEEFWIAVESPQRCLQQESGSQAILALQVVKCRSHLNQSLQKGFLRLWQL